MSFTKSGEILRIGHGNYCYHCIHCGLNFVDIKEILAHIDYHFIIMNDTITNSETTNNSGDSKQVVVPIQQLSVHEVPNCADIKADICSEIKTEDDIEENRSEITIEETTENIASDIKIDSDAVSITISKPTKRTATKRQKPKIKSKSNDSNTDSNHQCSTCELNFDNSAEYWSHLRVAHHVKKVFQCYICGLHCKSFKLLRTHMSRLVHSKLNCYQCESEPPITNELDARPHKCFICKQWFENHMFFRRHSKDDHQEDVVKFYGKRSSCNEYTCYICKKDFLYKSYLRDHMKVHNERKPFVCDVCGKAYRKKAILGRHLNVHEGRTYTCEDCGKTFPYYARLRIHRYSHRTELNYKCTVCSKAFKIQKYLARHMKLHQEEKKYACKYCEKRFTFSTGRRAHEISQHNAI